jgi:multiple sugar transport system ATP-binding protein
MTAQPRLLVQGLSKSFDGVPAVKRLDLALEPGEFVSLLGPSGCGKSTTLAMIAGFVEPGGGTISIAGRRVDKLPPQRRGIGLVFQDYAVFTRLSVRKNLLFGLEAQRVPRTERQQRLLRIAERLDLGLVLDHRGSSLNMSEMQRVALARVLVTNPSLLLLDEPMSNLDAAVRSSLRSELKRIQTDLGQSVLYVTHDQVEAMSMSDRIAIMSAGEILQIGTPEEIYHHPVNRFVAEFIGDPPINVLKCELRTIGGDVVAETILSHSIPLGRGNVRKGEYVLAIRPHDLVLDRAASPESSGLVRLIENLGAERVVHVEHRNELAAVMTGQGAPAIGERVGLALNPGAHAHLIDVESGAVMQLGQEALAA